MKIRCPKQTVKSGNTAIILKKIQTEALVNLNSHNKNSRKISEVDADQISEDEIESSHEQLDRWRKFLTW